MSRQCKLSRRGNRVQTPFPRLTDLNAITDFSNTRMTFILPRWIDKFYEPSWIVAQTDRHMLTSFDRGHQHSRCGARGPTIIWLQQYGWATGNQCPCQTLLITTTRQCARRPYPRLSAQTLRMHRIDTVECTGVRTADAGAVYKPQGSFKVCVWCRPAACNGVALRTHDGRTATTVWKKTTVRAQYDKRTAAVLQQSGTKRIMHSIEHFHEWPALLIQRSVSVFGNNTDRSSS